MSSYELERKTTLHLEFARWHVELSDTGHISLHYENIIDGPGGDEERWDGPGPGHTPWLSSDEARALAAEILDMAAWVERSKR